MSYSASINTFAVEAWLWRRFAGSVTLGPTDDNGEDDDDDAEDADGDGGPVREHYGRGIKQTANLDRSPESILLALWQEVNIWNIVNTS